MSERITIQELVVELLFEGSESGVTKFNSALSLFRSLAGAAEAAVATLTRAVVGSTLEIADQADALGEAAEQVGVSAVVYDALTASVQRNGGSVEELDGALRTLTGNLSDFIRTGKGAGESAFMRLLGPDARQLLRGAGTADEALGMLADALAGIEDPIERVALANDVLGRSGNRLLPALSGGSAGIRGAVDAMREMGTYSPELIQAGSDLGDALADLGLRWRGLRIIVGEETVPALRDLVEELVRTFDALRIAFGPELRQGAQLLAGAFRLLRDAVAGVREDTEGARRALALVQALLIFLGVSTVPYLVGQLLGLVYWFSTVGTVAIASAVRSTIAWLAAAAPFVLLAALVTAIILILDDLITYVQGGDSAFGALLERMREGEGVLASLADFLAYIFGGGLGEDTYDAFERLSEVARAVFDGIVDGIRAIPGAVASAVQEITGAVPDVLAGLGEGLGAIPGAFASAGQALAGAGGGSTINVGGSTVSVAVNGSASPRETGAEVARQVGGVLDAHTTQAARDLAPALVY